jgi:hypothetical protein
MCYVYVLSQVRRYVINLPEIIAAIDVFHTVLYPSPRHHIHTAAKVGGPGLLVPRLANFVGPSPRVYNFKLGPIFRDVAFVVNPPIPVGYELAMHEFKYYHHNVGA